MVLLTFAVLQGSKWVRVAASFSLPHSHSPGARLSEDLKGKVAVSLTRQATKTAFQRVESQGAQRPVRKASASGVASRSLRVSPRTELMQCKAWPEG